MSQVEQAVKKVPFIQKVAFGLGMLANQMFPAILGIFMVVLIENLGFPGWMYGLIAFAPRVFDSITDPIMGFISDNTRSKWGRRRQYVLIGGVVMGIAFIFMWQLFKENSLQFNFWYFFLWSIVFYLGLTIFSVPYVAMGYEMSDDFHERTNIMATAQWIGQWAWVIAPWFWIIMYDPEWFATAEEATRTLAYYVAIPCAICAIIPAIFIPGESTVDREDYEPLTLSKIGGSLTKIFGGFRDAFRIKYFRQLCFSTFLIFNSFNTVAALTFFVIVYKLFNGDAAATGVWVVLFGSIGALCTTFIVIPIVTWMSKAIGKRKAFLLSQGISLIGYTLMWFLFVPGKPWLYLIALPFFSFGIGSLFTIMMSMTADVIDIDELNTGLRREGIFGAIYWWMVKFGFAIAGGLSGLMIAVVGFDSSLPTTEQQGAVDGLHAFFCFFPMLGTIGAILIMWSYDLTEEKANKIRATINARKLGITGSSAYLPGKLVALHGQAIPAFGVDFSGFSSPDLHRGFTGALEDQIPGLCFSPYLEGQDTDDVLSAAQIRHRISIIKPYTRSLRSFSCTGGNELTPGIAREHNLDTMVGAWISRDKKRNQEEIANLIQLAQAGEVNIAAVGNEVLLRNELAPGEIIKYLKEVRAQVPASVPVGYVDAYYQFLDHPDLIEQSDVILINCYPFWEGATIETALGYLERMYEMVKAVAKGKEVIIAETGWPSKGQEVEGARPSAENAMKYFINVQQWSKENNITVYYFTSFDETWKTQQEGEVGARWGLWNKDEQLKYGDNN
ncbi:MFS transporter [Lewinella sp. W8]|uniref:MFS transporter n=1 Tax=Lewinella sp. W8 TaxID=2528208 RepID=UPI0010672418|nr:MFS transporter [Lewinella sp. W8]MTB50014.1 MFS transporter [Lewinella sp. W8]